MIGGVLRWGGAGDGGEAASQGWVRGMTKYMRTLSPEECDPYLRWPGRLASRPKPLIHILRDYGAAMHKNDIAIWNKD